MTPKETPTNIPELLDCIKNQSAVAQKNAVCRSLKSEDAKNASLIADRLAGVLAEGFESLPSKLLPPAL